MQDMIDHRIALRTPFVAASASNIPRAFLPAELAGELKWAQPLADVGWRLHCKWDSKAQGTVKLTFFAPDVPVRAYSFDQRGALVKKGKNDGRVLRAKAAKAKAKEHAEKRGEKRERGGKGQQQQRKKKKRG